MRLTSSKGAIGGKGGHTLDLSAFRFASAAILTLAGGGPCGSGGTPLKRGCSTTRGAGATAVPFATGFAAPIGLGTGIFRSVSPVDFGGAGCCFLGDEFPLLRPFGGEEGFFALPSAKVVVVAFFVFF